MDIDSQKIGSQLDLGFLDCTYYYFYVFGLHIRRPGFFNPEFRNHHADICPHPAFVEFFCSTAIRTVIQGENSKALWSCTLNSIDSFLSSCSSVHIRPPESKSRRCLHGKFSGVRKAWTSENEGIFSIFPKKFVQLWRILVRKTNLSLRFSRWYNLLLILVKNLDLETRLQYNINYMTIDNLRVQSNIKLGVY